jgi:glycogen synthase
MADPHSYSLISRSFFERLRPGNRRTYTTSGLSERTNPQQRAAGTTGPLTICLVSEEFPPETGWGGIGTYTYNLAEGLVQQGHRVHVITRTWNPESVKESNGVIVHRLVVPEPSWRRGTYMLNLKFAETRSIRAWNSRVASCIQTILAQEPVDIVESPEYRAQALRLALKNPHLPLVVKLHTPAYLCREVNGSGPGSSRLDTWLSEHLEYRLARRAMLLTSPSRQLARDVAQAWRLRADQITVVPNPIDDDLFCPAQVERRDGGGVLYVGRLQHLKGVEHLCDAFALVLSRVPGATLKLVGADHPSGPGGMSMKQHLQARMRDRGIPQERAVFTGAVPRKALPDLYRSAGVCVVPSLYENLPYTCLEAMACGCATIASKVGGIPEIITDGIDGRLVPPAEAGALASAIGDLLLDAGCRERMGRMARQTIGARFRREAVSRQTSLLYMRLVNARRG